MEVVQRTLILTLIYLTLNALTQTMIALTKILIPVTLTLTAVTPIPSFALWPIAYGRIAYGRNQDVFLIKKVFSLSDKPSGSIFRTILIIVNCRPNTCSGRAC